MGVEKERSIYEASGLKCPSCAGARWEPRVESISCLQCASVYAIEDGVLRMDTPPHSNEVSRFYALSGGTHFVGTTFADNPQVYCTTRTYRNFLAKNLPRPAGSVLDFGCGDGRLSLWALQNQCESVVAMDDNLPALKRLAEEGRKHRSANLLIVCADATKPPFPPGAFDVVLCFEVLYYLVGSLGRVGAIKTAADLVKTGGKLVLSEFGRFGHAMRDVAAMNLENGRSLEQRHTRWEKFGDSRIEVFHWNVAELKKDCAAAGLTVIDEMGVSPIPALFHHAWTFTSYPLRPPLDSETQGLIEGLSDKTSKLSDCSRNILLALEKP